MTTADAPPVVEVFADVGCPFTHVGLRRFLAHREAVGRTDVLLRVRAWPLEIVNGAPLDPAFIAEEVDDIRSQVAPDLFTGFVRANFPSTSLPALAVAAAAYRAGTEVGETVSLALRTALFEAGEDISRDDVLAPICAGPGVEVTDVDRAAVLDDHREGVRRGVIGSPHFFTPAGDFFCPALDVSRDDRGHLRITADPEGFQRFLVAALGS